MNSERDTPLHVVLNDATSAVIGAHGRGCAYCLGHGVINFSATCAYCDGEGVFPSVAEAEDVFHQFLCEHVRFFKERWVREHLELDEDAMRIRLRIKINEHVTRSHLWDKINPVLERQGMCLSTWTQVVFMKEYFSPEVILVQVYALLQDLKVLALSDDVVVTVAQFARNQ